MRVSRSVLGVCLAGLVVGWSLARPAAQQDAPEYGPAKGALVIVGGNMSETSGVVQKFMELGGGPDGRFVIVPTAGGNRNADGSLRVCERAK